MLFVCNCMFVVNAECQAGFYDAHPVIAMHCRQKDGNFSTDSGGIFCSTNFSAHMCVLFCFIEISLHYNIALEFSENIEF